MDRPFVYPNELPMVEDFLNASKFSYVGLGHIIQAAIGNHTGVSGFAISATSPASMTVNIDVGSIYVNQQIDANAYSTLGTDSNQIMKQGILIAPTTVTCTAPTTSGFEQYYLVEVGFNEVDDANIVPPYLNTSDPTTPLNGANNSGANQPTVRQNLAVIALKAGTASATGTAVIPSPDAGFTPLWVIHVINGQTQITSTNWFAYAPIFTPGSPWFPALENLQQYFIPVVPFIDFYVTQSAINASDSNSGSQSQPFLTIQGAINAISGYVANNVNVHVSAGIYTIPAGQVAGNLNKCQVQNWNFIGAGAGLTIINATATGARGFVTFGPQVNITGFTIGAYYEAVNAQNGGVMFVTSCNFTGSSGLTGVALSAYQGGICWAFGGITITGNYGNVIAAAEGQVQLGYKDVNITRSVSIIYSGVSATINAISIQGGSIVVTGAGSVTTISGTLTGTRYFASANGTINTNGAGINLFPGTIAGSTNSGGQYT